MWVVYKQTVAVTILSQIILITCANFDPQQYALANALQSILSPANTEKALQIIQTAARQVGTPCREEKVASTAQPNRRLIPIGAVQRHAPNSEQFLFKQNPQYAITPNVPVPENEVVPSNALLIQNPTSTSKFTMPNVPLIIAMREPQASSIKEASCPCASQTLVNPFLPAASPISALSSPTSNLLPSAFPMQSRGHFLRKIPIPPPTL